jgi:20S proteasome alpha/beta subunit
VTIAAGFVCKDGIVLAADTKESFGPEDHTYVSKISILDMGNACQVGIAGSGDGYLIDYIVPRIKNLIAESPHYAVENFEEDLGQLMAKIYASEEVQAYPKSSASDLYTSLLLAARFGDQRPALFIVNSSLVTQIFEPRIIGYGPMQEMANEICSLDLTVQEAGTAALYLIYDTKRRYSYAGGVVHIFKLFDNKRYEFERTWDQAAKEALFNDLRLMHYRMVITVATPNVPLPEHSRVIKTLTAQARKIRAAFEKIEDNYQEWVVRMMGGSVVKFKRLPRQVRDAIKGRQLGSRKPGPEKSK